MNVQNLITFLPTEDLLKTRMFYKDILGLNLVRDQGDCVIFRVTHDSFIGFCRRQVTCPPQKVILTLVIDDVDEMYQLMKDRNAPLDSKPVLNHKYNIYHFFVRDPNGYLIEFQKFIIPLE